MNCMLAELRQLQQDWRPVHDDFVDALPLCGFKEARRTP